MIAYLLFFCVAGLPALFHFRRKQAGLWAMAWLVYVLFLGLRHEVGGDWTGYLIITETISNSTLQESMAYQEPLYALITWASTRLGFGVYGSNLFGAVVFCTGLFAFCARLPNRWLALAAATPFLVIVAVMSGNRQGMAIGVLLFVMSRWKEWGLAKRALGTLLAGMFHSSAILLLVLTILDLKINRAVKFMAVVALTILAIWLVSRSDAVWYRYTTIYRNQSHGAYSPGAIQHLSLNLVPAVLMLLSQKSWQKLPVDWGLLKPLCWMAVGLLALVPFFTVAVGRMSLYLFPVSISFIATFPSLVQRAEGRALIRLISVTALGGVLAVWLAFANTAFTYHPYQNALFIPTWELALPR